MFNEPVSTEGKEAVGNIRNFPLFFGTVLFALEAIGVVSFAYLLFLFQCFTLVNQTFWRLENI